MIKRIAKWTAAALIALVAWIGLVEILIRLFFPQPAIFHSLDPELGYVGIPGASGWYMNKEREFRVKLKMNEHGFRDVHHDVDKPPNTFRIIFLGDSFTEAKEVELEETYWRILQRSLPKLPDGRDVEVLNMAYSGYSNGQELLLLKSRALVFKPDLVVVGLTEFSDIWNNSRYLDCLSDGRDPNTPIKPYFYVDSDSLSVYPFKIHRVDESLLGVFRRNFQTYMYLRNLAVANPGLMRLAYNLGLVATPPVPKSMAWKYPPYFDAFRGDLDADTHWIEAYDITRRLLAELERTCESNGAKLLVMIIPSPHQIYPDYQQMAFKSYPDVKNLTMDWPKPGRTVNAYLQDLGIASLYLYPLVMDHAKASPGKPLYFTVDIHFNAPGHQFVSEILKERILEPDLSGH